MEDHTYSKHIPERELRANLRKISYEERSSSSPSDPELMPYTPSLPFDCFADPQADEPVLISGENEIDIASEIDIVVR